MSSTSSYRRMLPSIVVSGTQSNRLCFNLTIHIAFLWSHSAQDSSVIGVAEFPFMQLGFEYDLRPRASSMISARNADTNKGEAMYRFSYTTCKVLLIIAKLHAVDITVNSLGFTVIIDSSQVRRLLMTPVVTSPAQPVGLRGLLHLCLSTRHSPTHSSSWCSPLTQNDDPVREKKCCSTYHSAETFNDIPSGIR